MLGYLIFHLTIYYFRIIGAIFVFVVELLSADM